MVGRETKSLKHRNNAPEEAPSTLASLVPDTVPNRSKTIKAPWQHLLSACKGMVEKLQLLQYYEVTR